jgi:hypothetical protein
MSEKDLKNNEDYEELKKEEESFAFPKECYEELGKKEENFVLPKECTGLIFRYRSSCWINMKGSIQNKQSLIFMKKLSCDGNCQAPHDFYYEVIRYFLDWNGNSINAFRLPEDTEDGDLLELNFTCSFDPYSGELDDADVYFEKVGDENDSDKQN